MFKRKKKLIYFFFLLILLINNCQKSFQEKGLEVDNEGRGVSISIVYPESNLNTYQEQAEILCKTTDKLDKISQVDIRLNGNPYAKADLVEETWEKTFSPILEKNTVCAKVTTNLSGIKETCRNFYKTLFFLEDLSAPLKSGSCVYYQNKIYCAGGEGNEGNLLIYDSLTGKKISKTMMKEHISGLGITRKFTAATELNGDIYLLGGLDEDDLPPINFVVYKTGSQQWEIIPPTLNIRVASGAVSVKGKIYFIGGGTGFPGLGVDFHNSIETYQPDELPFPVWQTLPYPLNYPRAGFTASTDGRFIYVAGGYNSNQKVLNSAEVFDTDHPEQGWKLLPLMNSPRFLAAGGLIQNRYFYLFGGINFTERLKTIERFDLAAQKWEITGVTDYIVTESSFASDSTNIYLIGGVDKNDNSIPKVVRFKPYLD